MIQIILGIILTLITGVALFIKFSPQFGAKSTGKRMERIKKSPNYLDGKFINMVKTPMSGENTSMWKNGLKFIKGAEEREPKSIIETIKFDRDAFIRADSGISVIWFGHSTLLMNIEGRIILSDPVFSESASPISFIGAKRFDYSNQFDVDELPELDAIIISHDHYDHLDYETIRQIKQKTKKFYVPLGIAAHLIHWGVEEEKIVELDWWDEAIDESNVKFVATPSRHFSGRAGIDKDRTLWCSWVIQTDSCSIYFGGDSGYGDHFKQIGEKYGPFDFTMLECGQYNEGWPYIHMMPEETVQSNIDLKGKTMLPIHWGKFNLSLHAWTEPIERAKKEAIKRNVQLVSPLPGKIVNIKSSVEYDEWWEKQVEEVVEMNGN